MKRNVSFSIFPDPAQTVNEEVDMLFQFLLLPSQQELSAVSRITGLPTEHS